LDPFKPAIAELAMPVPAPLPVPTWTCPHCGFVHRPADLLRLDSHRLQFQEGFRKKEMLF